MGPPRLLSRCVLLPEVDRRSWTTMKCNGCGAELAEDAKTCTACGKELSLGQKTAEGSLHVAKETGVVAGKIGKGLWGGAKAVGAGAKKGFKGSEEEKKES